NCAAISSPLSPIMNDSHDKDAELIAEAFHGEWSESAPAKFALIAAARARRRHRARRAVATATACVLVTTIGFLAFRDRPVSRPQIVEPTSASRSYEVISDDELMSQLRDRPLLVVKTQNGGKQFVLLEN